MTVRKFVLIEPHPPYNRNADAETQLEVWAKVCLGLHDTLEIVSGNWFTCNEKDQRLEIFDPESDWLWQMTYERIQTINPWV